MKTVMFLTLTIISATLLTSWPSAEAQACGNSRRHDYEKLIEHELHPYTVMRADEYLQQHRWSQALAEIQGVYPELRGRSTTYQTTKDLELKRAAKIAAITTIRLRRHRTTGDKLSAQMTSDAHVAWATKTLEHLSAANPDDPELMALYADALAIEPTTKAKALTILSDLHTRDLLPSAYSYALLSKLQTDANDKPAAKEAYTRCMAIASNHEGVCSLQLMALPLNKLNFLSGAKSGPRAASQPSSRAIKAHKTTSAEL